MVHLKMIAIVKRPYFVVKRGADKNKVQDLNGKTGKIVSCKLNGSVFAEFDGEIYQIPRDAYKLHIK